MPHALAVLVLAGVGVLPEAEDDLAVVRRALARPSSAAVSAKATTTLGVARRAERPRWLKVRVTEGRSRQGTRVSVDLPLALVRALGGRCPLDPSLRLSEVLDALGSGQRLVEIQAEDATVRAWVE